jgi:hypothetical protein
MGRTLGDGAVQIVEPVAGDLVGDASGLGLALGQAHLCDLRVGEGDARDHAIIRLEALEAEEQAVDGRVPGLVGGHMGKLMGADHVAAGEDAGIVGLQEGVGLDRPGRGERDTQDLQSRAGHTRALPDRAEQEIEGERFLSTARVQIRTRARPGDGHEPLLSVHHLATQGLGVGHQSHAVLAQARLDRRDGVVVLFGQDAGARDLSHPRADGRKRLGKLAADRSVAEDDQPLRLLGDGPEALGGDMTHPVESGNVGDDRGGTGGDHDGSAG